MVDIFGDYRILNTDYENTAIVYSCMNFFNVFSVDYTWFITRERTVDKSVIDNMYHELAEIHPEYTRSHFYQVKQGGKCKYSDLV